MMPASIFLIEFAAPGTQSLAWLRLAIGLSLLAQLGYSYWRPTDRPFFDGLTFLNMALVGGLAVFSLYINDFQETQRVQSIMLLAITSLVTQRKRAFITYLLLVNVGMLAAAFGCGCGRIPFTYTIVTAVYSLIAYLALANLNLLSKELAGNLKMLSEAQQTANFGTWIVRPGSNSFQLSEFSAKIFGLAGAQAVPFREFLRIIHPDDRELIKKTLNTRLGTADTSNIYYRVITPNGQPRYINGVSRMVLVDGQPLYYGLVRDITAEKLAEIELKNTQQFFQSVLDNLPLQVTVQAAPTGQIKFMNQTARSIRGLDAASALDKTWAQLATEPVQIQQINEQEAALLAQPDYAVTESEDLDYPGWVRNRAMTFTNAATGQRFLLRIGEDISSRKETEQKLLTSEANLRTILETSPQGIILLDLQRRVLALNPASRPPEITKEPINNAHTMVGQVIDDYVPEGSLTGFHDNFTSALTGRPVQVVRRFEAADHTTSWFKFEYTPVFDQAGQVSRVLLMITNITSLKQAQAKLERSVSELETSQVHLQERERYLQLLVDVQNQLISEKDLAEVLQAVCQRLGAMPGVGRVTFWVPTPDANSHVLPESTQRLLAELSQAAPVQHLAAGLANWEKTLRLGQVLIGPISDFFADDSATAAIYAQPILLNQFFWGALVLEYPRLDQLPNATEQNYLRLVASSLATYLARQQAAAELKTKERFLSVLVYIQYFLIAEREPSKAFQVICNHVGRVCQADRLYIFTNHTDEEGQLYCSQQAEWVRSGISAQRDNPQLAKLYYRDGLQRWAEQLSNERFIMGPVAKFPESERAILEPQGIKSVVVLPLVLDKKFLGFVGVDYCQAEGDPPSTEMHLLRIIASNLTAYLGRLEAMKAQHERERENAQLLEEANLINEQLSVREAALLDSEKKFKLLADNTSEMIALSTPEGNINYLSPASETLTGYQREELYGKSLVEFFHPEDIDQMQVESQRQLEDHAPVISLTHRFLTKTGHYIWLDSIIKYITDERGNVINLQSSSRNVTERVRAAQALQESEAKYRFLFNQNFSGVFLYQDLTARYDTPSFVEVNDFACQLLGYTRAELLQLSPAQIEVPIGKEAAKARRHEFLARGQLQVQTEFFHKDGHKIPVEVTLAYVRYGDQQVIQAIANDVSQKRQAEENLKARQLAEQALQFKTDFLANMSHEIRTPMNGILGMTGFLLETPLAEEQLNYASTIQSSARNLLQILNDILDLSKLEAGKINLKAQPFDFHKTIHTVKGLFSSSALQRNVRLASHYQPEVPTWVIGDENRLNQVLTNLVSNAIKFTQDGRVDIHTSLIAQEDDRITLKVAVQDTGIGIAADHQENLFEKFYQVEAGNLGKNTGTGLGLSICKQLVQLWGGEIGLTSQPGQGSTFWFTLPLGLPVQATTLPVAHTERGPKRHYQLTNLNILLAEDIFVNQEVVRIMVKNAGEIIDIANNGQEALAKAQQKKYEVILMDIQMPVLDGLAATKLIRQSVSPVPIIIGLSANAMEGDAERYIAQGMDDYVAKPVDPDALFGKLARWFPSQVKITEQEVVILPPTPVLEPSVPVLNLTVIEKIKALSRNNEAYLKQLFTSFDSDMAQLLAQASASLSANDLPGLASAVHTLKGLAGTIGASQLHELAKIFDHEIKLKQLANAPERLAALREVFAQTQTALFKLLS